MAIDRGGFAASLTRSPSGHPSLVLSRTPQPRSCGLRWPGYSSPLLPKFDSCCPGGQDGGGIEQVVAVIASLLPLFAHALAWKPGDSVTVLWGYFDETGHPSDPNVTAFGVCGLRATSERWLTFSDAWNTLLATEGIESFHMKTFYSPHHVPYNGWSAGKKEDFLMSLLELIETVRPVLGSMKKFEEGVEGAERETIQEEWRESYHGCIRSAIVDLPADAGITRWSSSPMWKISATRVWAPSSLASRKAFHRCRLRTTWRGSLLEMPETGAAASGRPSGAF